MEKITLTQAQKQVVLDELEAEVTEDGSFDIDIDLGEKLTVNINGWLETEGYVERDTNAYVETYRNAEVAVVAFTYNDLNKKSQAQVQGDFERVCKEQLERQRWY